MKFHMDRRESISLIEKHCRKLKRGDRIKIGEEVYEFLDHEFSNPIPYPQFEFYRIGEPIYVCLPLRHIIEIREDRILFYEDACGEALFRDVTGLVIEF
jgi:hypothetical protein